MWPDPKNDKSVKITEQEKAIKNIEFILDNNLLTEPSMIRISARYDFEKNWKIAFNEDLPTGWWRGL